MDSVPTGPAGRPLEPAAGLSAAPAEIGAHGDFASG